MFWNIYGRFLGRKYAVVEGAIHILTSYCSDDYNVLVANFYENIVRTARQPIYSIYNKTSKRQLN